MASLNLAYSAAGSSTEFGNRTALHQLQAPEKHKGKGLEYGGFMNPPLGGGNP